MAIIVSDANIFIDIYVADLLAAMFRLPDTFVVPDILYREELQDHYPELPALGLRIEKLESAVIEETIRLRTTYPEPSTNDLMALALAKVRKWMLLTGDDRLRDAGIAEGVDLHGTLWLMEAMHEEGIVNDQRLVEGYDAMLARGRRLPWDLVARQKKRLIRDG